MKDKRTKSGSSPLSMPLNERQQQYFGDDVNNAVVSHVSSTVSTSVSSTVLTTSCPPLVGSAKYLLSEKDRDEVKKYIRSRYVSTAEAMWQLSNPISPLPVLPGSAEEASEGKSRCTNWKQ